MFDHFKINNKMSFLLNLFGRPAQSPALQCLEKTLQLIKIDSEQALPDNYYELLFLAPPQGLSKPQLLQQLVGCLQRARTEAAVVKLYTIIMCAIRMSDYEEQCCSALQGLQGAHCAKLQAQKSLRLLEFQRSCNSYLIKLPSVSQLYLFSLSHRAGTPHPEGHIALYRLMNQFGLLFPQLNTTINTFGRYFRERCLYFKQFYRVWRSEVVLGYGAMKKVIDQLVGDYRKQEAEVLECFLGSVPEIELLCDQMENFITNKYYKGSNPNKKVYFRMEALQEIEHHLAQAAAAKLNHQEEDFIRTADSEFFSLR